MDNILKKLSSAEVAVDLGCGGGSFSYQRYECKIIGIDVSLNQKSLYRDGGRVQYLQCVATHIPLLDHSVDAVICNHTFEHFAEYKTVLAEIDRILKHSGALWISIPNGFGFDDALYRRIFSGGGHVNRFTFQQIVEEVRTNTSLKLVQSVLLQSGFVYLKKPAPELKRHFPNSAKFLFYMPTSVNRVLVFCINAFTRFIDKVAKSHFSQYGWGCVFARGSVSVDPLESYFNVCWKCGSGDSANHLRAAGRLTPRYGIVFYNCANCETRNLFFEPPSEFT
jgi:ubiquinone/menaquinone biosynthesis C-methylase UbiE